MTLVQEAKQIYSRLLSSGIGVILIHMKTTLKILILTCLTAMSTSLSALADPLPDELPPINAFTAGLGFAGVALTSDPGTVFWNPAGLGSSDVMAVDFTAAAPTLETPGSWSFLVANSSSQEGSRFGFAAIRRHFVTDSSEFKSFQLLTPLSYGFKAGVFPVGISMKFICENKNDADDWNYGMAFDAGALWITPTGFTFGASVHNFAGSNLTAFERKSWLGFSWGTDESPLLLNTQICADRLTDPDFITSNFSVGMRALFFESLPTVVAGFMRSDGNDWATLGVGYNNVKDNTTIEYTYVINPVGWEDAGHFLTYSWGLFPARGARKPASRSF